MDVFVAAWMYNLTLSICLKDKFNDFDEVQIKAFH